MGFCLEGGECWKQGGEKPGMLMLRSVSLGFGGRVLLDHLNWQMKERDRVALIGGNGVGKTSLMKIIAGWTEPDEGDVITPKGTTFGYLPQEGLSFRGKPLFEEVKSVLSELLSLEAEIQQLEHKMAEVKEGEEGYEALLQRYDHLTEQFRQRGWISYRGRGGADFGGAGLFS